MGKTNYDYLRRKKCNFSCNFLGFTLLIFRKINSTNAQFWYGDSSKTKFITSLHLRQIVVHESHSDGDRGELLTTITRIFPTDVVRVELCGLVCYGIDHSRGCCVSLIRAVFNDALLNARLTTPMTEAIFKIERPRTIQISSVRIFYQLANLQNRELRRTTQASWPLFYGICCWTVSYKKKKFVYYL